MNRKVVPALVFIFFFLGVLGFYRYSFEARMVDAVGLFTSGVCCGAALVGLVFAFRGKPNRI